MAERNLSTLLKTLEIKRHEGVWTFSTIPAETASWAELVNLQSVREIAMMFTETEGLSLIHAASEDTAADNRWVWLELSVFSDLNAVGFLAAIAAALTAADIPCNAVAAYHHDHIFVPETRVADAIAAMTALT